MPRIGYDNLASLPDNDTTSEGNCFATSMTMTEHGWITTVAVRARAFVDTSADYRIGLWDQALVRKFNGSLKNMDGTYAWHTETVTNPLAVSAGNKIWVGLLSPQGSNDASDIRADFGGGESRNHGSSLSALPNPLAGSVGTTKLGMYADYTANVAPSTPTWRTPSANGTTVNQTPTLEANLLQGADAALDTVDNYQLQVYVLSNSAIVLDTTYATTTTDRTNGYWSRSVTGLSGGVTYGAKVRHQDSFGVWSGWSAERTFITAQGPNAPTPVSPLGKINAINAFNVVATHTHPTSLNADRAQVRIRAAGGALLYDSGILTITSTAPGANVSIPWASITANSLTWGTNYTWEMATRDTALNWGSYTAAQAFNTDAAPNAPVGLSPANNQVTGTAAFSATATDPDGDAISTAQIEIALVSTGATVSGYPASMTVNTGTGQLTYTAPGGGAGSLTLGTAYKWRARANDGLGPGYGAYSEWAYFTYASVPTVGLLGPMASRVNDIKQPSAEYDPTDLSAFWTLTANGSGQSIARTEEDTAPYGAWVWRFTGNASGTLVMETTDYMTVDATKSRMFSLWARSRSGAPTFSFEVLAYSAANALLGTLSPQSFLIASTTAPPTSWTRYGGMIAQIGSGLTPAFPATTTKIKIRITMQSTTGVMDVDAISTGQLAYNPTTTQERTNAQDWFGYADGDEEGFAPDRPSYLWTGVTGDSASQVLSILTKSTAAGASVVINYTGTNAKANDRLQIQRWRNGAWEDVYDSNPTWATTNGNRLIIPLPTNVIENEGRYQLKVIARDAIVIDGESPWVEFDVYYTGPAQLDITIAQAIPEAAQVRLVWNASALVPSSFAGIEIQRVALDDQEDTQIIGVLTDPTATEFIDHYPAANREYRYRIRQREQVGTDQTASFWASADISCDYYPYTFLKDVDDPTSFTAFDTEAANLSGYDEDAPVGVISPWGAARPTVLTRSRLRIRTGTVVAGFFPDAGIEVPGFLDADTRFENAAAILKARNTIALLQPAPEQTKLFAAIIGPARTTFPYPPRVRGVEFQWQEVSYTEDYYERNGIS